MRHHSRLLMPAALVAAATLLASTLGAGAATVRHVTAGPVRGGTISIAFTTYMVSLDPAQAYGDDWVAMNGTLFNGLYQFDRAGQPQLDLAAAPPTVSADRKTWTFTLRKGVLFSNGMEATADDLAFSILRTLSPHTKPAPSWGQTADAPVFVGGQDFAAGKTTTVSGIQVLDRYTLRFVLTQPVAVFPYILAETFNMIVPKAVVTKVGDVSFGNHPVGTGPFMVQSWQRGTKAVFVRNPHYFRLGKPYLDGVTIYENVAPSVIALRVEKGELTGFGAAGEANPADLAQARHDPKYAGYLVTAPTTLADWMDLNVHVPPLDNLTFRQAVAMAINRDHLVRLTGGNATPAHQIYIPLDPQYDPTIDQHPVYPYDPVKAAALLKASGYHGQTIEFLYSNTVSYMVATAPAIQQDLQQIGLTVKLRGVSGSTKTALIEPLTGHQLSTSFWGIDYPDAYDIYTGKMSCSTNVAGSPAAAHYCDPVADSLVNKAETLALGPDRNALLRQAQVHILRAATMVPLIYPKSIAMVSPTVGGYYFQPLFYWQFENYWLKP